MNKTLNIKSNKEIKIDVSEIRNLNIVVEKNVKAQCILNFGGNFDLNNKVVIKAGAELKIYNIFNGDSGRESLSLELIGEGAVGEVYSVGNLKKKDKFELNHNALHTADKTSSNIYSAFVVDDNSQLSLKEEVCVKHNADNCIGSQKAEILMLSENAKVQVAPNLKIENENVKCSHGVSITKFNEEKKFYLNTKGLNEKQVEEILVSGHLSKAIKNLSEEMQNTILKNI
ncbi:MAG: SufD family Fe-S cluster assembly protein [Candidatus Magasanikbacteria bacterium]|nr:SufD family Fe-S cluster assembly protein [Candidatus Magasanikbacteria bacterium]